MMTNNNQPIFTIENGVLKKCDLNGNTHIVLPDTVKEIGEYAFLLCKNLTSIKCPNVQKIGWNAFSGCKSLTSIECPNVQEISAEAFYGCANLGSIECPNVQEIGWNAFSGCKNLTNIECPNVKEIGWAAFEGCNNLKEIILSENNPKYYFEDGILYNKDQTEIIWWNKNMRSHTVLPSVTKIGRYAFSGCKNLTSIECPNVQEIDSCAFSGYKKLKSIKCPNVTKIGKWAFSGCKNLTNIECSNVQEIEYYDEFRNCKNLIQMSIPYDVLKKRKDIPTEQRIRIALWQVSNRTDWSEEEKNKYQAYVSRSAKKLVCEMIDREDMEGLILCGQAGILTRRRIDSFVEYAAEKGKVAFTAYLMNYKNEHFPVK